jgi:hypothetical protein
MREHPWVHVNGKIEIPSIPPKLSGKVDSSKLGQVVKSINSDKAYQVYTFNYHDQQKTSNSKAAVLTKQRSNSAALARRKSISLMPAAIADQCVKDQILIKISALNRLAIIFRKMLLIFALEIADRR